MVTPIKFKDELQILGYTIIPDMYSYNEIDSILNVIERTDTSKPSFRKSTDLFAIRQFVKEVPASWELIYNERIRHVIHELFGFDYFLVKSIYFDKPGDSNWFVSYHQDLTISVDQKLNIKGFGPWSAKQDQFAVQPPINILEQNFTIRIHLDDTDETNGALRVIPGSHAKGIYRPETIDWHSESEVVCSVSKGGIMIMRPLLLHASSKSTSTRSRRVIHLEFSNQLLPDPLKWSEKLV